MNLPCPATRAAMCALVMAGIALGCPTQALGQAHNIEASDEIARLDERIDKLETAMEAQRSQSSAVAVLVAIAVGIGASTHSAYLVEWLSRHRLRPVLAWSAFGGGRKLAKRGLPDGAVTLMVRITNVGHVAAVDVVSRTMIRVSGDKEGGLLRHTKPDSVGSLHPHASMDIPVELSGDEHDMIRNGATATFEITLEYVTVNNRRYSYGLNGTYSGRMEVLDTVFRG